MRSACSLGIGSLVLLVVAGCATAAAPDGHVETLSSAGTCAAPRTLAATPTALDGALLTWSNEGATEKALTELDAACGDDQGACMILALVYANGEGVTRDEAKATAYRDRAMRHPRLQSIDFGSDDLAEVHRDQGLYVRIESSNCYFNNQPCERGCEDTCSAAATAAKARVLVPLQRACEKGRGSACHAFANLTEYGATLAGIGRVAEGGDGDQAKALRTKACKLGVAESCSKIDVARACELGLPSACLTQGDEALRKGDSKLAASIYVRTCELGMKGVCRDLAAIYGTGSSRAKELYLKVFGGEDGEKAAHFRALGGSDMPVTAEEL